MYPEEGAVAAAAGPYRALCRPRFYRPDVHHRAAAN